jgi:DNA-binding NtrC family response regulator
MSPGPAVLLADDQPLIRWAVGHALETLGARVVTASTYQETCDRLSSEAFEAVVLASPLEGRSLVGVLSELDRMRPQTRVLVLCSGEHCDRIMREVPRATVFHKPFAVSELMAAVAPALGVHTASSPPHVGALTLPVGEVTDQALPTSRPALVAMPTGDGSSPEGARDHRRH